MYTKTARLSQEKSLNLHMHLLIYLERHTELYEGVWTYHEENYQRRKLGRQDCCHEM